MYSRCQGVFDLAVSSELFDLFNNDFKQIQSCQRQFIHISRQIFEDKIHKKSHRVISIEVLYMHKMDKRVGIKSKTNILHLNIFIRVFNWKAIF